MPEIVTELYRWECDACGDSDSADDNADAHKKALDHARQCRKCHKPQRPD